MLRTQKEVNHSDYSNNPNLTYNIPTFFLQGHIPISFNPVVLIE